MDIAIGSKILDDWKKLADTIEFSILSSIETKVNIRVGLLPRDFENVIEYANVAKPQ